jgi:hypothetical protein
MVVRDAAEYPPRRLDRAQVVRFIHAVHARSRLCSALDISAAIQCDATITFRMAMA